MSSWKIFFFFCGKEVDKTRNKKTHQRSKINLSPLFVKIKKKIVNNFIKRSPGHKP